MHGALRRLFENFQVVTAGSFTLNGTAISVAANDTIDAVVARINASVSGVTAIVSADRVILTTKANSEDPITLAGDTSGFFAATKLASATTTAGNIRDDRQVLSKTSQFVSGDQRLLLDQRDVDRREQRHRHASRRLCRASTAANAGVTAAYDSARDRLVSDDDRRTPRIKSRHGRHQWLSRRGEARRRRTRPAAIMRDDQQVLVEDVAVRDRSRLARSSINGVSIAVNKDTDTVSSLHGAHQLRRMPA